ncbi:MAG: BamA/TamA family outer membrane protein [Bdellovibrionales bacterium]|nr:BamA/TamA family outer membrane protein [Bdellovibrionales bacterium]
MSSMDRSIGACRWARAGALALGVAAVLFAAVAGFAARAAEPGPLIHEIEIEGVTAFGEAEVTELVEVSTGERLDRDRAVRTANALRNLYLQGGYRDAKVAVRVVKEPGAQGGPERNVLQYRVEEGKPSRLGAIALSVREGTGAQGDDQAERALRAISADLDDKIGDRLGQDAVNELLQAVEERLAARGYLGGSLGQPVLEDMEAPKGKDPGNYHRVKLSLDPGDRVRFGFRGNSVLAATQLNDLISGLQELGLGRDYVEVIRNRILQEYRSLGFAEAKVQAVTYSDFVAGPRCGGAVPDGGGLSQPGAFADFARLARCAAGPGRERSVTFQIEEGRRYFIHSVHFDGNSRFESDDLLSRFDEVATYRVQRGVYVEEEVEKSAEVLIEWIKSQGFLSAKLVTVNRGKAVRGDEFPLVIYLYEGEQTLVRDVKFEGASAIDSEQISRILGLRRREPLNLYAFTEGLEALKTAYRRKGYLDAVVTNENSDSVIRYYEKNRFADVVLAISEGPRFSVSKVEVTGLVKTREEIVTRELAFREGGDLDEERLNTSESRLRRLGIFSNVRMQHRTDPERPNAKLVRVDVTEVTPGYYGAGVGYRNDLGVRVFGELGYSNIGGRNQSWFVGGNANRRIEDFRYIEYQVQVGYVWPWFVGAPELTFRPQLTQERRQFINFDAETSLFTATWERSLWEKANLFGALTYSLELTRQFNAAAPEDNVTLTIGALIPSVTMDLRDNPLSPTRGFFGTASFEVASTAFGSQADPFPVGYTRFQARSDYTLPVGRDGVTLYASFRTGVARNTVSPLLPDGSTDARIAIPLIKQFALGGVRSLRGYKLQELNEQKFAVQGTLTYVNYRTQLDVPIAGSLKFGPFLDAANLLIDRYSLGSLRYGAGVGLHYQTPVGPVNFDVGFKLNREPGEEPNEFHFSVGVL